MRLTMRATFGLVCSAFIVPFSTAIYRDDVGVLDFSVATAGHGSVGWASQQGSVLLTTDVPKYEDPHTSCYVAGRNIEDGSLLWRRSVCVRADHEQSHAIAVGNDNGFFYTVSNSGLVRAWTVDNGALVWEAKVETTESAIPKIFAVAGGYDEEAYVAVAGSKTIYLLDSVTGSIVDTISSNIGLNDGRSLEWFSVHSSMSLMTIAFAKVSSDGIIANAGSDFQIGTYQVGSGGNLKSTSGHMKGKNVRASSLKFSSNDANQYDIWAVTTSGSVIHNSEVSEASDWGVDWKEIVGIGMVAEGFVSLSGKSSAEGEATMEAFRFVGSSWKSVVESSSEAGAAIIAPTLGLVISTPFGRSVENYELSSGKLLETTGDVFGSDGDSVSFISVRENGSKDTSATVLIGTERGSTTVFSISQASHGNISLKLLWTAEEGLASLSSAIILDASHLGSDDLVEEQDEVAYKLSFRGRLQSQWKTIGGVISNPMNLMRKLDNNRNHLFGFLKVSALLSPKAHRVWGMSTAGEDRGSIRWSLDLPKNALWHSMVHGTTNAAKATHGIHGDTHSREILVLSALKERVDWMCIDGTNGAIHAQDSIELTSVVDQVLPVYGAAVGGGCRQASFLLGDDLSLTVVPSDAQTHLLMQKQLQKTPNGLYTHKIDRVSNKLHSYRVSHEGKRFSALPVGLTSFDGEQVVEVAYPLRHEDMQSMSTILGDNSLLLKYINPHMAVVVTMLTEKEQQLTTDVAGFLQQEGNGKPRKPVGAAAPGSSGVDNIPNMFVNLVDTVSGRVLYRHSHSNVDASKSVSVVISENWVVYTFVNELSRRTEVGVLTLHEGMIEPKGLTYFSRQTDQSISFSSFDARESKPVVLSKVYTFPKPVTALGVTSTKQGISRQNILLASSDGSLNTINKMILETRRPVGEAKPDEKKEGLVPYKELIPDSPLLSLNYNQTHEPFSKIVSTTTSLESQSLVLGFGGPDLFFTRTSPTKGFDLLPETFNKVLVGGTTVGIVIALVMVKRMGKKKALQQGWT